MNMVESFMAMLCGDDIREMFICSLILEIY